MFGGHSWKQSVALYSVFQWPNPKATFIVIGVYLSGRVQMAKTNMPMQVLIIQQMIFLSERSNRILNICLK